MTLRSRRPFPVRAAEDAETVQLQPVASAPRVLDAPPRRPRTPYRGPLLEVDGLCVRFGGMHVLEDVHIEVREREIVGLIGPNGAGKTTLFNCVSGFVQPQSGSIRHRGRELNGLASHRRAALGIARTFQLIGLAKTEDVLTNLLIAQHLLLDYADGEALAGLPVVRRQDARARERAEALLEDFGLSELAGARAGDLSHGTLKLVEIACAVASGPDILLLDEPSSGMSPRESMELGRTIRRVADRFHLSVLVIEHHVPLVLELCDYAYAIDFGRQIAQGAPLDVSHDDQVVSAYLGQVPSEALQAEGAEAEVSVDARGS